MKKIGREEEFVPSNLGEKAVVIFWAAWCGPCRMTLDLLTEIEGEREDLSFSYVDADEREDLAKRYGIRSIPTVLMFKNGQQVGMYVGHVEREEFDRQAKRAFGDPPAKTEPRTHIIEVLGKKHEKLGYHSDKVENRYVTVVEATRYPNKARAAEAAARLLAAAEPWTYVALHEV